MNFSISGGIGLLGGWGLFGALMIVFTVVATLVIRAVRGPREGSDLPPGRAPEDDYIL